MPIPAPAMDPAPPRSRGVTVIPMRSRGVVSQPEDRHKARKADRPFLLEHDILAVKNTDDVTWEFRWDRRRYPIRPQETGYVPFPAVAMRMGDPRSMENEVVKYNTEDGQRGICVTRHEELTRLCGLYGVFEDPINYPGINKIDLLVDYAPKMEVTTMEGDPVIFPVQQPDMVAFPVPNAPEPGKENSDMRRLTDKLQSENEDMRAELESMRQLIHDRLGGDREPDLTESGDQLAAVLAGGGASADTGPQTRI